MKLPTVYNLSLYSNNKCADKKKKINKRNVVVSGTNFKLPSRPLIIRIENKEKTPEAIRGHITSASLLASTHCRILSSFDVIIYCSFFFYFHSVTVFLFSLFIFTMTLWIILLSNEKIYFPYKINIHLWLYVTSVYTLFCCTFNSLSRAFIFSVL